MISLKRGQCPPSAPGGSSLEPEQCPSTLPGGSPYRVLLNCMERELKSGGRVGRHSRAAQWLFPPAVHASKCVISSKDASTELHYRNLFQHCFPGLQPRSARPQDIVEISGRSHRIRDGWEVWIQTVRLPIHSHLSCSKSCRPPH